MNISLCKCGIDMSDHPYMDPWEDYPVETIPDEEHAFDSSGTKYRCEELISPDIGRPGELYLCPRPSYHKNHGVSCGPLNGKKLWE